MKLLIVTFLLMVPLLSLPKGLSVKEFNQNKTQYNANLVCNKRQCTYVITPKASVGRSFWFLQN